jgi:16S rRNA (cytidine1402-2'-O)-methyltransferase
MDTGRFTFEGFLSVSKKSRFEHLDEIKDEKRTLVFYEAPISLQTPCAICMPPSETGSLQ